MVEGKGRISGGEKMDKLDRMMETKRLFLAGAELFVCFVP